MDKITPIAKFNITLIELERAVKFARKKNVKVIVMEIESNTFTNFTCVGTNWDGEKISITDFDAC